MCLCACLCLLSSGSFDVYFSLREYKKKHKDISVELDCQQQMLVQLQKVGEVASATSVALLDAAMVFSGNSNAAKAAVYSRRLL